MFEIPVLLSRSGSLARERTTLSAISKALSQDLRVVETNPQSDSRWESFVAQHPNGSIYHHPAWLEILEREYGQKGVYLICEDASHNILAVLPLLRTRGLPFSLGRPLTGRRLSSLPRTPIAGPLSIDSRASAALLLNAIEQVSADSGLLLQIKAQGTDLDGIIPGITSVPWRLSYVLALPKTGSFRINNSHSRASVKWAINKAKRLGVTVRPAEKEADLRAWYKIYLETMRHNAVLARPYRFFLALWELLRPRGMMQLLVAEHDSMGRQRMIAGSIFLMFGQTVSYAFNGSRLEDLSLRPNDVIQWQAINEACAAGYRFLDFGEVPEGNSDLAKFKSKWGSEPVRLYRYYYPAVKELDYGSTESHGYKESLRNAIWRRLPLATVSWLGDRIYRYL